MSLTKVTTLLDFQTTAEVEAYMEGLVLAKTNSIDRQRFLSYLHSIVESDVLLNRQNMVKIRAAKEKLKSLQLTAIHHTDEMDSFFTASTETLAQMLTRLQSDDQVIYAEGKTFTSDIDIQGDRVTLVGGYTGLATLGNLVPGCTVNGVLKIQGDDIVIDGVKFESTTGDRGDVAISFTGASQNLTLRNCTFVGITGVSTDTKLIFGPNNHFSGEFIMENCDVQGFTDVHLADPTTSSSATPTTTLTKVVLKDSYFKNKGSMAFRNPTTATGTTASCTGCIFEVPAGGLDDLFWSSFEFNNFQTVTVTDNTATGEKKTNDDRGFCQVWSRAAIVKGTFKNNKIGSYDVGYQFAQGAVTPNFYGFSADSVFSLPAADFTDISNNVSVVYPWKNDDANIQMSVVGGTIRPTTSDAPGISIIGLGGSWVESP